MIELLAVWFLVLLIGTKVHAKGFCNEYLDRAQTDAVKGFFLGLVFLSHVNQYVAKSGYEYVGAQNWFTILNVGVSQLIVVMFLFYSGYGVMSAIGRDGGRYVNRMPTHRIFPTLLNFDVAVLLYVVVDLLTGVKIGIKQSLLSLVCLSSVGNSNWYIFVIIGCYCITWFSALIARGDAYGTLFAIVFLTAFAMFALSFVRPPWWYDTIMAYPFGCCFCVLRKRIECYVRDRWLTCLFLLGSLFWGVFVQNWEFRGVRANALAVLFAAIVVLLSMKVKLNNRVLVWLGMNLFPLYIYQRIPMQVVLDTMGDAFVRNNLYLYVVICIGATVVIAGAYRFWQICDVALFNRSFGIKA